MFRINLEGVAEQARADVRSWLTAHGLIEDSASDVRVWRLEPGSPQPGEPANVRPIAQAAWVAARGDELLCRTRAPHDGALLVADLARLARYEAMRDLDDPATSSLRSTTRVVVVGPDGQPLSAGATLTDGDVCDYEVHNDGDAPIWVALLELGADRSVSAMFPWTPSAGERVEPGGKFALAGDFLARHPDFESEFRVGVPHGHPWVVQPGPIPDAPAPCVFTLKAIVSTQPVALDLTGPVSAMRAALDAIPAGAWACVHVDQTVAPVPADPAPMQQAIGDDGREISPTGSGYVLVYWAEKLSGASLGGCLGVTATSGMPQMGENWGYWNFPVGGASWPSEFRLRPGLQGKTTVDGTGVPESQAINQFTGAVRRTNKPFSTTLKAITLTPSQVDQSWKVTSGSIVAYAARVGGDLHWFTTHSIAYLPKDILEFKASALPTTGTYYSAVDYLDI